MSTYKLLNGIEVPSCYSIWKIKGRSLAPFQRSIRYRVTGVRGEYPHTLVDFMEADEKISFTYPIEKFKKHLVPAEGEK